MTTVRALVVRAVGEPASVSSVCAPVRGQVAGASSRMRSLQSGSYSLSPRCAAACLDCAPDPGRPFAAEVGADPGRLRIGVLTADPQGRSTVDPDCEAAARSVADTLADLGHDVADGSPSALAEGGFPESLMATMAVVTTRALERWWEEDGWDLLLTPTTPAKPPPLGQADDGDTMTFTVPFNVSGQPAISLPLGEDGDGLPIGVQLVAAYGHEDVLLRVAAQLETAMPWADRRPRLSGA